MKTLCMLILTCFVALFAIHPQPSHATESNAEMVAADLKSLYRQLKVAHPGLYSNVSESAYNTLYQESLLELASSKTNLEQWAVLQKFMAFGKIGHARIDFPAEQYDQYRNDGGLALPLYPTHKYGQWQLGESVLIPELPENAIISHIDGESLDSIYTQMRNYISADSDGIAKSLLEFQFPQYFWLLNELADVKPQTIELTYFHAGIEQTLEIPLINKQELMKRVTQQQSKDQSPPTLRGSKVLIDGTAWLKPGPFYNAETPGSPWDSADFITFIDKAFTDFAVKKAKRLIIDLRNNPGGDNSFSDPLIAKFATEPFRFASAFAVRSSAEARASNKKRLDQSAGATEGVSAKFEHAFAKTPYGQDFIYEIDYTKPNIKNRFSAPVFALINQHSYSNAVSVAAITKDYGFGMVVGESTSDYATTYGAMETFFLEHTGYEVGFPKALIIRPSGDKTPGPVTATILIPNLDQLTDEEISKAIPF